MELSQLVEEMAENVTMLNTLKKKIRIAEREVIYAKHCIRELKKKILAKKRMEKNK